MPRLDIDYSKTIIYKLVCNDVNIKDCYVGATTNFIKRKSQHKNSCNNLNDKHHNIKVYQFIREKGGFINWSMIMIEEYSCENQLQSSTRERYWLETLGATLNSLIPSRSQKEYQTKYKLDNKEYIKEQKKQYKIDNREQFKEKMTCVCSSICRKHDILRHNKTQKHILFINQNKI